MSSITKIIAILLLSSSMLVNANSPLPVTHGPCHPGTDVLLITLLALAEALAAATLATILCGKRLRSR